MATPVSRVLRHFPATPKESAGKLSVTVHMYEVRHDEEVQASMPLFTQCSKNLYKRGRKEINKQKSKRLKFCKVWLV